MSGALKLSLGQRCETEKLSRGFMKDLSIEELKICLNFMLNKHKGSSEPYSHGYNDGRQSAFNDALKLINGFGTEHDTTNEALTYLKNNHPNQYVVKFEEDLELEDYYKRYKQILIWVATKEHYDKEGYFADWHIADLLDERFAKLLGGETQESLFEFNGTKEDFKKVISEHKNIRLIE